MFLSHSNGFEEKNNFKLMSRISGGEVCPSLSNVIRLMCMKMGERIPFGGGGIFILKSI